MVNVIIVRLVDVLLVLKYDSMLLHVVTIILGLVNDLVHDILMIQAVVSRLLVLL